MNEIKACPVCGHQHNEHIDVCKECGWDYPVLLGDSEKSRQAYSKKLEGFKQLYSSKASSTDEVTAKGDLAEEKSFKSALKETVLISLFFLVFFLIIIPVIVMVISKVDSLDDLFRLYMHSGLAAVYTIPCVALIKIGGFLIGRFIK